MNNKPEERIPRPTLAELQGWSADEAEVNCEAFFASLKEYVSQSNQSGVTT